MFKLFTLAFGLGVARALVDEGFSSAQLRLVRDRLTDGAHASWELGTAMQVCDVSSHPEMTCVWLLI